MFQTMDSPTLSQILLKPKSGQGAFMYPTCRKSPNDEDNQDDCGSPMQSNRSSVLQTTPASAPLRRSGVKSLGIRRRFHSIENSASPTFRNKSSKRIMVNNNNLAKKQKFEPVELRTSTSNFSVTTPNSTTQRYDLHCEPLKSAPQGCRLSPNIETCITNESTNNECIIISDNITNGKEKGIDTFADDMESKATPCAKEKAASTICINNNDFILTKMGSSKCTRFNKDELSVENPCLHGFKTASNKDISISQTAMNHASKIFQELNDVNINASLNIEAGGAHCIKTCLNNANTVKDDELPDNELILLSELIEENDQPTNACTSPILLRRSRKRKLKKSKKTILLEPVESGEHVICEAENTKANLDCSLHTDGIEFECLVVDLNEKFDKECHEDLVNTNITLIKPSVNEQNRTTTNTNSGKPYNILPFGKNSCQRAIDTKLSSDKITDTLNVHVIENEKLSNSYPMKSDIKLLESPTSNTYPKQVNATTRHVNIRDFDKKGLSAFMGSTQNILSNVNKTKPDNNAMNDSDDELLAEAVAQLDEEMQLNVECEFNSTETDTVPGFTSALTKKAVSVSESSLTKAKQLIKSFEKQNSENSSFDISHRSTTGSDNFEGFKTASNKPVIISEAALAKACEILSKDDKNDLSLLSLAANTACDESMQNNNSNCDLINQENKLANLFKKEHLMGKEKNKEFKAPRCSKGNTTTKQQIHENPRSSATILNDSFSQNYNRKLLGIKNHGYSQISVSDESLIKAAEMFENILS